MKDITKLKVEGMRKELFNAIQAEIHNLTCNTFTSYISTTRFSRLRQKIRDARVLLDDIESYFEALKKIDPLNK